MCLLPSKPFFPDQNRLSSHWIYKATQNNTVHGWAIQCGKEALLQGRMKDIRARSDVLPLHASQNSRAGAELNGIGPRSWLPEAKPDRSVKMRSSKSPAPRNAEWEVAQYYDGSATAKWSRANRYARQNRSLVVPSIESVQELVPWMSSPNWSASNGPN